MYFMKYPRKSPSKSHRKLSKDTSLSYAGWEVSRKEQTVITTLVMSVSMGEFVFMCLSLYMCVIVHAPRLYVCVCVCVCVCGYTIHKCLPKGICVKHEYTGIIHKTSQSDIIPFPYSLRGL